MEFLKKNYIKLIVIALLSTVFVLTMIYLISNVQLLGCSEVLSNEAKGGVISRILSQTALLLTFASIIAYLVLKMCKMKTVSNWIIFCGGTISLILFIVAFIVGAPALNLMAEEVTTLKAQFEMAEGGGITGTQLIGAKALYVQAQTAYYQTLFGNIINLIVFACMPVLFGIKKLFICKGNCENKTQA